MAKVITSNIEARESNARTKRPESKVKLKDEQCIVQEGRQ